MANFYCVFNEQESGERLNPGTKYVSVTTLAYPKTARVLKVEATTVAEVQQAVERLCGTCTSTPAVISEAQFKFS